MEKVYNKYGLGTLAFVVVVLNLIFPKPNLPMMSINIATCAIILHAYWWLSTHCLLYTSPSPRDLDLSRMPSSA